MAVARKPRRQTPGRMPGPQPIEPIGEGAMRQVAPPVPPLDPPRRNAEVAADGVRVRRRRRDWAPGDSEKRQAIAERVLQLYQRDTQARSEEEAKRLQRHAKLMMWTTGRDIPWPDASDAAFPDIMTHCQRTEDTLHNAVMSAMPPVTSEANHKTDKEKQEKVDRVIAHQVFNDQDGETLIGDIINKFVTEGVYTVLVPWVEERRKVNDVRIFPPMPDTAMPAVIFHAWLSIEFPKALEMRPSGVDGWDWKVTIPSDTGGDATQVLEVGFYTRENGEVEMLIERDALIFDGPALHRYDWNEVILPPRAENVQRPGPSNPRGAAHVILRSTPTISEIADLQRSGFYDLMAREDVDKLMKAERDTTGERAERQKDAMKGVVDQPGAPLGAEGHKTVTRLTVFDMADIDGDGIDEDVVWTVLVEPRLLVRARIMTEMYPANPPRRPLVRREFMPGGMSLPELLEGLHDLSKQLMDQTVDFGTIATMPFFFYRPTGGMKPETIRLYPGEGYPLNDPARDQSFPQISNSAAAFGINMLTILNQFEERIAMQGELQFGRVPAGKASALRTQSGMQMVLNQGEARPERILRRFFSGLTEIWSIIHQSNERFLKPGKVVKVVGQPQAGQEIYTEIKRRDEISGSFQFKFAANVFNTSRQALQQSLMQLMGVYLTPLAMQMGIVSPTEAYRLMRDYGKSMGQDPDQYLKAPSPDAMKPRIFAEDVITAIMQNVKPYGVPAEVGSWQEHIQKLAEFQQANEFGHLTRQQVDLFTAYVGEVIRMARLDAQRQAMLQAAQQFQNGQGQGQGGPPPGPPDPNAQAQPQISGNGELLEESLPGAGGGANQGAAA